MRLKRFFWIAPTTILLIVWQTFLLTFPMPFTVFPVVAQTSDARKAEADRLLQQGIQQYESRQFQAAIQSWEQALAICRAIGDRKGEGIILGVLGTTYGSLGNYAKAIDYLKQALAIMQEMGDRKREGMALGDLGDAYYSLSDYAKAIEYHQQRLAIARKIGDPEGESNALGNLGDVYVAIGDYAEAIKCFQQSLAIVQEISHRQGEGKSLGSLGTTYLQLGDYAKVIEYYQQSLAITKELGDRKGEGRTLGNLGTTYLQLGDYAKAIEYYQQSLAIAKEFGDHLAETNALGSLGNTYKLLGDYGQAIEYYQQCLVIAQELGNRLVEGRTLGNLGNVYNSLSDYAKAMEYHQQSLAIARAIDDRYGESIALGHLGNVYSSLGDYAQAIEYQQQSLMIAQEIDSLAVEGRSLNNLGLALLNSGNFPEAERILSTGIAKWEEIRDKLGKNDAWKVSIFEEQARTYYLFQHVLIAQNKTSKALEIAERGRARALVELLASRLFPQSKAPPPIKHPSLEDIKKIAQQQNATLVEYSIFDFTEAKKSELKLYIWVILPSGKVTFRSFDLKSLEMTAGNWSLRKLVAETLESLGVGEDRNGIFDVSFPSADPERQIKSLKQLHQLLIQPIADLLPTDPNERVIFIPHQDLFRVPFPALMDSDGKYLVEKHTILTAPSIQVLELTRKQQQNGSRSGQGALVVGNPSPMPAGFRPLKGAEKEAQDVAQLLSTQPLIGSQATKLAVLQQLPNARIIHLATHGTFNEQQPLLGGVTLAQTGNDPQNSGLLTAEEIFNLKSKLNAELLVLSACNTGRGRITGDGVIGLSRSFIAAGVPSVIVSLWSVPDAPTASLMSEFYTNLYQKKLDKAQALRQAMLKMMEKHRNNPRAWAAFTLIGEAE
jgi:tetratricopeptide (TPR) repeat protein